MKQKKPRRVVLTFEIETNAPLSVLRRVKNWDNPELDCKTVVTDSSCRPHKEYSLFVKQVHANVIRK